MANSLNRVMLMGNLTRDVELRAVGGSGQQVAKIGLALNRSFTTASGEKRDEVTFVEKEGIKGPQASTVKPVGRHSGV